MAQPVVLLMITAWLLAGALSSVLASSGFVDALVWCARALDVRGGAYVAAAFLACAVVSTSTGTSFGTILICGPLLYPAAAGAGVHPGALLGAILGGATFGDSISPVSDTTIASAGTQGADIGGTVRARLKYVLPAGAVALVVALAIGGAASAGGRRGVAGGQPARVADDPRAAHRHRDAAGGAPSGGSTSRRAARGRRRRPAARAARPRPAAARRAGQRRGRERAHRRVGARRRGVGLHAVDDGTRRRPRRQRAARSARRPPRHRARTGGRRAPNRRLADRGRRPHHPQRRRDPRRRSVCVRGRRTRRRRTVSARQPARRHGLHLAVRAAVLPADDSRRRYDRRRRGDAAPVARGGRPLQRLFVGAGRHAGVRNRTRLRPRRGAAPTTFQDTGA